MALRKSGKGGNGNFIAWLQTNLAELKKISAGHDERMRAHEVDLAELKKISARQKDTLEELKEFTRSRQRDVVGNRRQTREIIAQIARMDAARRRDSAALAHALIGINVRVRRLERKKPR